MTSGYLNFDYSTLLFVTPVVVERLTLSDGTEFLPDDGRIFVYKLGDSVPTPEEVKESAEENFYPSAEIKDVQYQIYHHPEMVQEQSVIPTSVSDTLYEIISKITDRVNHAHYSGENQSTAEERQAKLLYAQKNNLNLSPELAERQVSEYMIFIQELKAITEHMENKARELDNHKCDYPSEEEVGPYRAITCRICGRNGDI